MATPFTLVPYMANYDILLRPCAQLYQGMVLLSLNHDLAPLHIANHSTMEPLRFQTI